MTSFATLTAVLVSLLFVPGCSDDRIVVHVVGDGTLVGAELYVNDEPAGVLTSPGGDLVDASILVPHGANLIEVRKEGYESASKTLTFRSTEAYMSVKVSSEHQIFIADDGTTQPP